MIATIVEVYFDRYGDTNKGRDVIIRCLLFVVETLILHYTFKKPAIDCFILTVAIFFFAFDYTVQYVLIRNKVIETKLNWFEYVGNSSKFDKWELWRKLGPWGRFLVKSLVLIGATILFIV